MLLSNKLQRMPRSPQYSLRISMTGTKLNPEKITSPFQLMAAWFAMLVLLISILLTAAVNITKPDWAAGLTCSPTCPRS
jgi:hypothetical protein